MSQDPPKPRRSPLAKLLRLLVILLLGGVLYCVYLATQADDLTDIGGYGEDTAPRKNLYGEIKESIRTGRAIRISERDLNAYLQDNIQLEQLGSYADKVSAKDIWVRLEKDRLEVIVQREVWGYPQTMGANFAFPEKVLADGRKKPALAWESVSLGRLTLPQGYGLLVKEAFVKLAAALEAELTPAFQNMGKIKVEDGALLLDPSPQRVDG